MIHVKAPHDYSQYAAKKKVFLAGSIEMGTAEDWQERVVSDLSDLDIVILNPRREAWDSSWAQTKDNPPFREQVEWELQGLEDADCVLIYFHPATKAPISLLELGLFGHAKPEKLLVCCPDSYWRKGNVDIVCERYGIRFTNDLDEMIGWLRQSVA